MYTTSTLVEMIKKSNGNCTDYRISQLLGVCKQSAYNWANGVKFMGDEAAMRAAKLLKLDETYVIACINAERHQDDNTYPVWLEMCHRLETRRRKAA